MTNPKRVILSYLKSSAEQKRLLLIIRGPSGSGKSYIARQIAKEHGVTPFAPDDFFMQGGVYVFKPEKLPEAHRLNVERTRKAMENNQSLVIIDATNILAWEMKPYVELAQKYGYDVEFKEPSWSEKLKTPEGKWNVDFLEEIQQRPERDKHLPRYVLERMRDKYDPEMSVEKVLKSKRPERLANVVEDVYERAMPKKEALEKILNLIPSDGRVTMLKKPYGSFGIVSQKETDMKPNGLWYSCGKEWLEWVSYEMPHLITDYIYNLKINYANVLKISDENQIDLFTKMYGSYSSYMRIDWQKVAYQYQGIEICPYISSRRMTEHTFWYYGWDVASGCIWNSSSITSAELLYVYDNDSGEYRKPA